MSIVHTGRFIKNKRGKENEKKTKTTILSILLAAVLLCLPFCGVSAQGTQPSGSAQSTAAQLEEGLYF